MSRPRVTVVRVAIVLVAIGTACAVGLKLYRGPYVPITNEGIDGDPAALRVLFVGNSHTFVSEVPWLVQQLAADTDRPLEFEALLSPGKTISWHAEQGDAAKEAKKHDFHAVVFQPASYELFYDRSNFERALPGLRAQVPNATQYLFVPWPRHPERDALGRQSPPPTEVANGSQAVAVESGMKVAPVGSVWMCVTQATNLDLWSGDGNHAWIAGSFVAALTLYQTLFSTSVAKTTWAPPDLVPEISERLRNAVDGCLNPAAPARQTEPSD